jgi:hypothetical protein
MARNKRGAFGALTALLISSSLLIPSALSAQAAETPAPVPSPSITGTYEEQLVAYKIAFDAYKIALDMDVDFEGDFEVRITDPVTNKLYSTITMKTDYIS